ncbi:MAG: hypothetical protein ACYC27_01155 [Armatimonadota bacterium]
MTTEVQIKKNRLYLPYLRKVVSCLAEKLGMSGHDIEVTENAVSDICATSIDLASDMQYGLHIKLNTIGRCMTVDITDPSVKYDQLYIDEWFCKLNESGSYMELADDVEFFGSDEGATIRITKYASDMDIQISNLTRQLPFLGTASLQS